jgi:hypothetical protein
MKEIAERNIITVVAVDMVGSTRHCVTSTYPPIMSVSRTSRPLGRQDGWLAIRQYLITTNAARVLAFGPHVGALFGDELQITVTRFYFLRACPFLNWSANQRQPAPGL